MNNQHDKIAEYILSNGPLAINAFLLAHSSEMDDDEYILYLYKYYSYYPNSRLPTYRLFNFLRRKKSYELAYSVIKRGLEKFPDDRFMWKYYISIQKYFEDKHQRIDTLKQYNKKFNKYIDGYLIYARLLFENNEKNEAINLLLKIKNEHENDIELNRTLASLYTNIQNNSEALNILEKVSKNTSNISIKIDLLLLYIKLKKYNDVEKLFDNLIYRSEFLNSDRCYSNIIMLLDKSKTGGNIQESLIRKTLYYISNQKKDININENYSFPICELLMLKKGNNDWESIEYISNILSEFKNVPMFKIALFGLGLGTISVANLNMAVLRYIMYMKNDTAFQKLTEILESNLGEILSTEQKIYYALFFAVYTNNIPLRDMIVNGVIKNKKNYSEFILQIAEKWKKSAHIIPEDSEHFKVLSMGIKSIRIAVCVAGQLRGYEKALPTWYEFFHLSKHDTDFYVSTWKNIGSHKPKFDQYTRNLPINFYKAITSSYKNWPEFIKDFPYFGDLFNQTNNIDLKTIQTAYNTQHVTLEDDSVYPFNTFINQEKMFYKWNSCINMVHKEYDIIIRIRPDIKYTQFYQPSVIEKVYNDCLINNSIYTDATWRILACTPGCGDVIYIGKASTIKDISRIYCNFNSKKDLHYRKDGRVIAHYTVGAYMFQNGINIKSYQRSSIMVDKYSFTASEILPLIQKDIASRNSRQYDNKILMACLNDIEAEKVNGDKLSQD